MSGLPPWLRDWLTWWDTFWFAPVDARSVAAMRISLSLLLLWWWVWLYPELPLLFSESGLHDAYLLRKHWSLGGDSLLSPLYPALAYVLDGIVAIGLLSPEFIHGVIDHPHLALTQGWTLEQLQWGHLGGVVLLLAYLLGFGTDVVKFLVLGLLVVTYHRAPWIWNGGDRLMRIWVLFMCLTPSGAVWSVDAWIKERLGWARRTTVPVLVHRLVQWQLIVLYTWTGIDKAMDHFWQYGTAVWFALGDGGYARAPWLTDPMLHTSLGVWVTGALTYYTLVFEIGFGPGVLWKKTRNLTLAAGVALHTGIFFLLSVGMFGPASVWGYQSYLDWSMPKRDEPNS